MITTITDAFKVLKEKINENKRGLIIEILDYVNQSKSKGNCLLCEVQLESNGEENLSDSIQNKLCEFCNIKIHTKPPLFCLKMETSEEFSDLQNYLENTAGIQSRFKIDKNYLDIKELKEIFRKIENDQHETIENNLLSSYVTNYKIKVKKDRFKLAIKDQIKSKIKILEEQLILIERNHENAVVSGRFDDSMALKEIFFSLFESKIELEEKLVSY